MMDPIRAYRNLSPAFLSAVINDIPAGIHGWWRDKQLIADWFGAWGLDRAAGTMR